MFLRLRNITALVTVEPTIFFYFLAIYLLFSVFHPLVFSKVAIHTFKGLINTPKLSLHFAKNLIWCVSFI